MAISDPILLVEDLSVSYRTPRGWLQALQHVSLTIPHGQVVGLVGESGSGKSTVVLALLGLLGPGAHLSARRLAFADQDLLRQAAELRGRRIGTVFQDPAATLNPALTIGRQVVEPMVLHGRLRQDEAFARGTALLAELGIPRPAAVMGAYPHQLSGGMKQRVMIAAALAAEPELLLLDEPTTAVDVTIEAQILDLLEELRVRRGLSMLLVSHNLGIVDRICHRLTVLYAGRVVETGEAGEVLASPRHPYTRGLLAALPRLDLARQGRLASIPGGLPDMVEPDSGCNFRPRCGFATAACTAPQELRAIGSGREVRCHCAEGIGDVGPASRQTASLSGAAREPAVTAIIASRDLSRSFQTGSLLSRLPYIASVFGRQPTGPVRAVDRVSLSIRHGEIVGLVGESGCGKSTLARLLLRLMPADGGELSFGGAPVPDRPGPGFRRRAQIVFQNPDTSLNPRQTVGAILRRPLERFGLPERGDRENEVLRLLDLVRLSGEYRVRYPHQLSGGERQRVGIARALATRPEFLVCDEPVSALDISVQAAILNLLRDLRDTLGLAYLFISHDIGVIFHIADRVVVMYRGRIVEEGAVAESLLPPYHPYTEALLSAVPIVGTRGRDASRIRLAGDPAPGSVGAGCCFAGRCPRKLGSLCDTVAPPWRSTGTGHRIACHIPLDELGDMSPRLAVTG